jgi:hypothetical protein
MYTIAILINAIDVVLKEYYNIEKYLLVIDGIIMSI